jgi:hypothetical protein
VKGRFTISVQSVLELQQQFEGVQATNGLGIAANFASVEVYADVIIRQVS